MQNQPFSVLMSVYHRENPDFLARALESISSDQILKPNEIVIVKDGPLGEKLEGVIEDFSSKNPVQVVSLPTNQGLGIALSKGVSNCSNEIIARMDSDDISYPERFSVQIPLMNEFELDVIGSVVAEFWEDENKILRFRDVPETNDEIIRFAKYRNPFNHPSACFRKSSVLAVGNYTDQPYFEDYMLWLKMISRNKKLKNIKKPLLKFRISNNTFSRRGGLGYCSKEFQFFFSAYRENLFSFWEMSRSLTLRIGFRLIPPTIMGKLYGHLLRK